MTCAKNALKEVETFSQSTFGNIKQTDIYMIAKQAPKKKINNFNVLNFYK